MLETACYCYCPQSKTNLTFSWCSPYKVVGTVDKVDYKIEFSPRKVKAYHVNMLKRYFHHGNEQKKAAHNLITEHRKEE